MQEIITPGKKDVHPGVRKEWKRLREAEEREKERPENVGCVIRLDTRQRKLYRDNNVMDCWDPQFFKATTVFQKD